MKLQHQREPSRLGSGLGLLKFSGARWIHRLSCREHVQKAALCRALGHQHQAAGAQSDPVALDNACGQSTYYVPGIGAPVQSSEATFMNVLLELSHWGKQQRFLGKTENWISRRGLEGGHHPW